MKLQDNYIFFKNYLHIEALKIIQKEGLTK